MVSYRETVFIIGSIVVLYGIYMYFTTPSRIPMGPGPVLGGSGLSFGSPAQKSHVSMGPGPVMGSSASSIPLGPGLQDSAQHSAVLMSLMKNHGANFLTEGYELGLKGNKHD